MYFMTVHILTIPQFKSYAKEQEYYSTKELICSYIESLHSKYKPKSIKRKLATLKAFYEYLTYEELIPDNPFSKIHIKIKEPIILPKIIPEKILTKILNTAYQTLDECKTTYSQRCVIRDIAVLELLFSTGLRVSELCNLKADDVNLSDSYVKTFGKGSKERIIQICTPDVLTALKQYKKCFKAEIDSTGYFFVNRLSNRLSEQSVRFMINKYVNRVSSTVHVTPHMFRHPYVKLKLKFLLTQHYRCISAKVLNFPLNFKPVVGVNIHLVYKHICECLCQGVFLFHCFCCLQSF